MLYHKHVKMQIVFDTFFELFLTKFSAIFIKQKNVPKTFVFDTLIFFIFLVQIQLLPIQYFPHKNHPII